MSQSFHTAQAPKSRNQRANRQVRGFQNERCKWQVTRGFIPAGRRHNTPPPLLVLELGLELEVIQTQMAQKPILLAEVYARALRASQNRKENYVEYCAIYSTRV